MFHTQPAPPQMSPTTNINNTLWVCVCFLAFSHHSPTCACPFCAQARHLPARALPKPHAFCLHAFATSLLWLIHIPTPCACPTLLIVLAMYVMPTVFCAYYHCMCGNTFTIQHAFFFLLSLSYPTSTVCPITRPTHAWRGPPLRACHVYIHAHVYVCVCVM